MIVRIDNLKDHHNFHSKCSPLSKVVASALNKLVTADLRQHLYSSEVIIIITVISHQSSVIRHHDYSNRTLVVIIITTTYGKPYSQYIALLLSSIIDNV